MDDKMINVNTLSRTLGLSDSQASIMDILIKTDDHQLDVEHCREKLKVIEPYFLRNFQSSLKVLDQKGIVAIGYEPDGTRYVKMSPEKEIEKLMNNTEVQEYSKIEKANRLSKKDTQTIRNKIVELVSAREGCSRRDLFNEVSEIFPITEYQFRNIFYLMVKDKIIECVKDTTEHTNCRRVFIVSPEKEDESTKIDIRFNPQERSAVEAALRRFKIVDDPEVWIQNKIENIILNLFEDKLCTDEILFDLDDRIKLQWLNENHRDENKNKADFMKELNNNVKQFIDKHYTRQYVHNQFSEIIVNINDAGVLNDIKNILNKKFDELKNPAVSATR